MTRCENMNHHTRNGLMVLLALTKLHVDPEHQDKFIAQIDRIEEALSQCNCECKNEIIEPEKSKNLRQIFQRLYRFLAKLA